jgi:UDP-N-acetylmuramate dehydrogenase
MLPISTNIKLADFTTFLVGGITNYFLEINSVKELLEAVQWSFASRQTPCLIGGGSNVLISSEGYRGLVLRNKIVGISSKEELITVNSGEPWNNVVNYANSENLSGIECLAGIPGTAGGALVQNIGAFGQEIKDVVEIVDVLDLNTLSSRVFSPQECNFDYRNSRFKHSDKEIVTRITLRLHRCVDSACIHKEVIENLQGQEMTPKNITNMVLGLRRSRSTIWDLNDPDSISAGSFFTNPIIANNMFEKIRQTYINIPNWPSGNASIKISAGWLIERAGFPRGYSFNDHVGLSSKSALIIINKNSASSQEIKEFAKIITQKVFDQFSIELKPEPVFIGV